MDDHHSPSDEDWKSRLTPERYQVLRCHATERAGTSPLLAEKRPGVYHCAGCDTPLFKSDTKYESGSGWPSFWDALPGAVATTTDSSFGMVRTEIHCANCGGHLGHVFPDGPQPTGERYCTNGLSLSFKPAP